MGLLFFAHGESIKFQQGSKIDKVEILRYRV